MDPFSQQQEAARQAQQEALRLQQEAARQEALRLQQEAARQEALRLQQEAARQVQQEAVRLQQEAARQETLRLQQSGTQQLANYGPQQLSAQLADAARYNQQLQDDLAGQQTADAARYNQQLQDNLAGQQTADAARYNQQQGDLQAQNQLLDSQRFAGTFAQTDALRNLWNNTYPQARDWDDARERFWSQVNDPRSDDAREVRRLIEAAGYAPRSGALAPLLQMQGWDSGSRAELDARTLSLDHATPKSKDPALVFDAKNLRFMPVDDNRARQARWDAKDNPYGGWDAYRKRRGYA